MNIAVAKGDGIGPEIMEVVLKIFNATKHLWNTQKWKWVNGYLIKDFPMV